VTDAEKKRLRGLSNRTESVRGPIEGFSLTELPPKILKICPELESWRQVNNERIRDHFSKLNTTLPAT